MARRHPLIVASLVVVAMLQSLAPVLATRRDQTFGWLSPPNNKDLDVMEQKEHTLENIQQQLRQRRKTLEEQLHDAIAPSASAAATRRPPAPPPAPLPSSRVETMQKVGTSVQDAAEIASDTARLAPPAYVRQVEQHRDSLGLILSNLTESQKTLSEDLHAAEQRELAQASERLTSQLSEKVDTLVQSRSNQLQTMVVSRMHQIEVGMERRFLRGMDNASNVLREEVGRAVEDSIDSASVHSEKRVLAQLDKSVDSTLKASMRSVLESLRQDVGHHVRSAVAAALTTTTTSFPTTSTSTASSAVPIVTNRNGSDHREQNETLENSSSRRPSRNVSNNATPPLALSGNLTDNLTTTTGAGVVEAQNATARIRSGTAAMPKFRSLVDHRHALRTLNDRGLQSPTLQEQQQQPRFVVHNNDEDQLEGEAAVHIPRTTTGSPASVVDPDADDEQQLFSLKNHTMERDAVGKPMFRYSGSSKVGPSRWGNIAPEYATCGNGVEQSPLDVRFSKLFPKLQNVEVQSDLAPFTVAIQPFDVGRVVNNGHSVLVNLPPSAASSTLTYRGTAYHFRQFHVHTPAEHGINGQFAVAGLHLMFEAPHVHAGINTRFVAVEVPLALRETGSAFLDLLVGKLPARPAKGATAAVMMPANDTRLELAKAIFGANPATVPSPDYYTYHGSLTTPPCSENVKWFLLKRPLAISDKQLRQLEGVLPQPGNARPVQNDKWRSPPRILTGGFLASELEEMTSGKPQAGSIEAMLHVRDHSQQHVVMASSGPPPRKQPTLTAAATNMTVTASAPPVVGRPLLQPQRAPTPVDGGFPLKVSTSIVGQIDPGDSGRLKSAVASVFANVSRVDEAAVQVELEPESAGHVPAKVTVQVPSVMEVARTLTALAQAAEFGDMSRSLGTKGFAGLQIHELDTTTGGLRLTRPQQSQPQRG